MLVAQGSSPDHDSPEGDGPEYGDSGQGVVPTGVAETLRRRLARLSNDCARLLDTAAVIGREIDVSLLTQIGVDAGGIPALLDEALVAGVLAGTSAEPRFTHDLYRETILAGLPTSERAATNLAVGRALLARPGGIGAARIAGHLLAPGTGALREAMDYSILAAREATARLGHDDACAHYLQALRIMDEHDLGGRVERAELLLELAAAHERTGATDLAMQRFREVALLGRDSGDPNLLARGALGMQSLGDRSGSGNTELVDLLQLAGQSLADLPEALALRSRVYAAFARSLHHAVATGSDPRIMPAAQQAVELALASGDDRALATARLALQDSMWVPGSAASRLPVIVGMLEAATACGDRDLVAEAHLLRAAALIELGDPAGRSELLAYTAMAERARACSRSVGGPDPASHVRPDSRSHRRSGEAGRRGLPARDGDRHPRRRRMFLQPAVVPGGPRRRGGQRSRAGRRAAHGHGRAGPVVADVPDVRRVGPSRPGRHRRDEGGARRLQRPGHSHRPGPGGAGRRGRRLRGRRLGGPAGLDLPATPTLRRQPRHHRRLRLVPRRRRPSPGGTGRRPRRPRLRRPRTSEQPWPCTSGSVRPDGVDCPRRRWPI